MAHTKSNKSTEILRASSISEFLDHYEKKVEQWSDEHTGALKPWCRGHSNASHKLIPGEYRHDRINPDEIRSEFQLKAWPLVDRLPSGDWEWYFLMQHYGLPTRLLDWTTAALVGLYFALRDNDGTADAAVWILDPWNLNKKVTGKAELILTTEAASKPYLPPLFSKNVKIPSKPIAIVPPYNNPRIAVQQGAFTVHGSDSRGIENIHGGRLAKIEIPSSETVQMRRRLRLAGIGEFTVFPDLDGLCREIRAVALGGG